MLHFTDGHGNGGQISDSLDVTYTGLWEQEVQDFVAGVEVDASDDGIVDLDPETYLLVELPEVVPIVEIVREIP